MKYQLKTPQTSPVESRAVFNRKGCEEIVAKLVDYYCASVPILKPSQKAMTKRM